MHTPSPSPNGSPHILDLSSKLASLEQDVAGRLQEVRGTVGMVLGADVALPGKATELTGERIHAGVRPAEAAAPPAVPAFQPYERTYAGDMRLLQNPHEERVALRWERANDAAFHTNPGALLRGRDGTPDAALTARRYAELIELRAHTAS